MTTPTTLSRVLNPLAALLIVAAVAVLLVPVAVPAAGAQAHLQGFVLQLIGTVTLLGSALLALVAASSTSQQAQAIARKTTAGTAARTAVHPAGAAAAAA